MSREARTVTDMTLAQAANELGKMGNFGRAIAKADEVANLLLSLVQQENDLKRSIEGLRAEATAAAAARDRATADGIATRKRAQSDAEEALRKAAAHAAELVAEAKAEAAAARDLANTSKASADDATRQRAAIKEEINAARAELEQIRRDIEDAKAEARRRFGS